jgi:predicted transglutaminase-like cysteine proteinase
MVNIMMKDYWNNKHPKKSIIYAGRGVRGYDQRINIDVRNMVWGDDAMLQSITSNIYGSNDEKALIIQRYIVNNFKYVDDKVSSGLEECWMFPNESLVLRQGDCEDGSILMASLMLNAGIPNWRVRVTAGLVKAGKAAETGGHCYVTYCRETDNNWVILDWCYLQDANIDIKNKPIMRDKKEYLNIWFSFNDEYSWSHETYGVIEKL